MGAVVLGPAAKVEHASMHTEAAEAAILDVNLNGRRVFPIADELMRRGVPFVFFSGDEDIVIPERLRCLVSSGRSALAGSPLLLGDVEASARRVERTLERAIGEIDRRRAGVSTEDWLNGIMRNVARSSGASLLH